MAGRSAALPTVAVAVAVALAFLPGAAAHPESAAPSLRPDVLEAGHEPAAVEPHTQWRGYLRLAPGSNVTAASYQVCRVGDTCFAPPAPAQGDGNGTFRFDTSDYRANGRPVDYQAGWRLGVKWLLEERQADGTLRTVPFPQGPDLAAPECRGDAALACAEAHYLAFDLPPKAKGAPAAGLACVLAALVLAALLRR